MEFTHDLMRAEPRRWTARPPDGVGLTRPELDTLAKVYFDGESYRDLGAAQGVSHVAILHRVRAGRRKLRAAGLPDPISIRQHVRSAHRATILSIDPALLDIGCERPDGRYLFTDTSRRSMRIASQRGGCGEWDYTGVDDASPLADQMSESLTMSRIRAGENHPEPDSPPLAKCDLCGENERHRPRHRKSYWRYCRACGHTVISAIRRGGRLAA